MKIALLNDSHFGAANSSTVHDLHIKKFFDEVFFPYIDEHQIENIIHLGDVFDNRKVLNIESIRTSKEYFFDPVCRRDIRLHIIIGNHDSFYKNTIKVNSPSLVLCEYGNIEVIDSPTRMQIGEGDYSNITMIPWICEENQEDSLYLLSSSPDKICMGHFEIAGFKFSINSEAKEGMSRSLFKRFDTTLSGHYHHKNTIDNIHYLGAQYDLNWADYGDPKFFHVFDTVTGELTPVNNPNRLFIKADVFDYKSVDIENKIVRMIISDEISKKDLSIVTEAISKQAPASFQIVDNTLYDNERVEEHDVNIEIDDTEAIIRDYVSKADITDTKRKQVEGILIEMLQDARTIK